MRLVLHRGGSFTLGESLQWKHRNVSANTKQQIAKRIHWTSAYNNPTQFQLWNVHLRGERDWKTKLKRPIVIANHFTNCIIKLTWWHTAGNSAKKKNTKEEENGQRGVIFMLDIIVECTVIPYRSKYQKRFMECLIAREREWASARSNSYNLYICTF